MWLHALLSPVPSQLPQPCSVIPGQEPPAVSATSRSGRSGQIKFCHRPEIDFRFSHRVPTLAELCRINCDLKVITVTLVSDIPNRTSATLQRVWLTHTNLTFTGSGKKIRLTISPCFGCAVCTWDVCAMGSVDGLCTWGVCAMGYVHEVCVPWGLYMGLCTMGSTWGVCTMGSVHGVCTMRSVHGVCTMGSVRGMCAMGSTWGVCTMGYAHGVCTMGYEHGVCTWGVCTSRCALCKLS